MIDKDSLPLDRPRRTPDHPTKSHVVKTRVDGKEKIIRFGEQGAKTAGKPKEGESEAMKQKRASFKARHAKNIAKGKSSPAYWADKVKWATGGDVSLEDLDEKYEGIKKPDFKLLESFRQMISDLQARAEESGTQEFDPLRALGRSGAAESLEDLYASYADRPKESHARRAEAGAEPVTEADMGGISAAAEKALAALRASWSGPEFDVISGYRDPERNKRVGGAKGSQHLHGNAFDINTEGWTPEEKLALADAAYDAGFRGFGFYNNNLHFDVASPRAWGPSYKRESVPLWAQDWVAQRFAEGGLAELAHKYDKGGKKKDDEDELARAVRLRDLELMAEPKNPNAVPAEEPRLLNVGGLEERLAFLNQTLNPVEAIGEAMRAGSRLTSADASGYDRLAALGDMLSGVAGVAGPAAIAKRVGTPAAAAVVEALTGASPATQEIADMARKYAVDESGALRLYHGSPHDFDRFSMSKIGTGEGAQAYGHGLYFAESEDVAKGYRDQLAPMNANIKSAMRTAGGDIDAAIQNTKDLIKYYEQMEPSRHRDGILNLNRMKLGELISQKSGNAPNPGRMYEVNVNANPEDFIDWDRPLSEQSEKVRDAFASLGTPERLASVRGENAYRALGDQLGALDWPVGADAATRRSFYDSAAIKSSESLREAGIPGIRYLDAGSRSFTPTTIKDTPEGSVLYWGNDPNPVDTFPTRAAAEEAAKQFDTRSRNYVVFDENLIEIVRKYGIAGAAAALGVSQADVAQAMQQGSASQYDPDAIEARANKIRKNEFATGGAVKYDPSAVDRIINQLREVNRG